MLHHSHDHSHAPETYNRAFALACAFNLAFIIFETFYAFRANSMSLLADAGHNLGDVTGLLLAWGANYLLTRTSGDRFSYGYKKTTILASLINALLLVGTSVLIAYEAVSKLIHPTGVNELIVIAIAAVGILVNGGTALLFTKGKEKDLNIKGAFVHLAADALISFGVVVAGILIFFTGWQWLDPVVGLIIVLAILIGTWELLLHSINLVLAGVPHSIDQKKVREYLSNIPGVSAIHDVHIWGISTQEIALTAHLIMPNVSLNDKDYQRINHDLLHQFDIHHVTLQIEKGDNQEACGQVETCG